MRGARIIRISPIDARVNSSYRVDRLEDAVES